MLIFVKEIAKKGKFSNSVFLHAGSSKSKGFSMQISKLSYVQSLQGPNFQKQSSCSTDNSKLLAGVGIATSVVVSGIAVYKAKNTKDEFKKLVENLKLSDNKIKDTENKLQSIKDTLEKQNNKLEELLKENIKLKEDATKNSVSKKSKKTGVNNSKTDWYRPNVNNSYSRLKKNSESAKTGHKNILQDEKTDRSDKKYKFLPNDLSQKVNVYFKNVKQLFNKVIADCVARTVKHTAKSSEKASEKIIVPPKSKKPSEKKEKNTSIKKFLTGITDLIKCRMQNIKKMVFKQREFVNNWQNKRKAKKVLKNTKNIERTNISQEAPEMTPSPVKKTVKENEVKKKNEEVILPSDKVVPDASDVNIDCSKNKQNDNNAKVYLKAKLNDFKITLKTMYNDFKESIKFEDDLPEDKLQPSEEVKKELGKILQNLQENAVKRERNAGIVHSTENGTTPKIRTFWNRLTLKSGSQSDFDLKQRKTDLPLPPLSPEQEPPKFVKKLNKFIEDFFKTDAEV